MLLQCRGVDTTGTVPKGQVAADARRPAGPRRRRSATSPRPRTRPSWRFDAYADAADRGRGRRRARPAAGGVRRGQRAADRPLAAVPRRRRRGLLRRARPERRLHAAGAGVRQRRGRRPAEQHDVRHHRHRRHAARPTSPSGPRPRTPRSAARPTVACSLVAVPIVGVSCDAWGTKLPGGTPQTHEDRRPADRGAADHRRRHLPPDRRLPARRGRDSSQTTDQAVRGNLWWSASNWRNRITVPLTFAATGVGLRRGQPGAAAGDRWARWCSTS